MSKEISPLAGQPPQNARAAGGCLEADLRLLQLAARSRVPDQRVAFRVRIEANQGGGRRAEPVAMFAPMRPKLTIPSSLRSS
jgi:hypothetical protein